VTDGRVELVDVKEFDVVMAAVAMGVKADVWNIVVGVATVLSKLLLVEDED